MVFSALVYLQGWSLYNRTVMRLKRLKQPKYLVGAVVGGIYFYFYFFRYLFGASGRGGLGTQVAFSPENRALLESVGALALCLLVLLAWVFPHQRAALAFTEAEVAFLFPAPISRRGLIHFKLLRSQLAILFTTLLLMLFTNRFGGKVWIHIAGWWLILSTLNLHFLGASFGRTMLLDRGITNWQRRFWILALLLAAAVAVFIWARRTLPALDTSQLGADQLKAYAQRVLTAGPLPYLLFPFRLIVRPYLAPNGGAFLGVLGPALFLLAAHYWWVMVSNVAFEEASLEASTRLAEKITAARAGQWRGGHKQFKRRRAAFSLQPDGMPAIAFLWKNIIAAGQIVSPRLLILLGVIGVSMCVAIGQSPGGESLEVLLGMIAGAFLTWSVLLGPQVLRQDFRQDLLLADVLKTYPLPGWQIALGELLAPAAILTAIQWLLLALAVAFFSQSPLRGVSGLNGLAIGIGAALVLPVLNLLLLQIPNAAVLLFPAWFAAGRHAAQGVEATGQRIIFMFGQLLVLAVALLPATVAFALVFYVSKSFMGLLFAIPLGAAAAGVILAAEATLGVLLLGWLFARFDVSAEHSS